MVNNVRDRPFSCLIEIDDSCYYKDHGGGCLN